MRATARVEEIDGKKALRIDVGDKGVDIRMPCTVRDIEAACRVLHDSLAGITLPEIIAVAAEAAL